MQAGSRLMTQYGEVSEQLFEMAIEDAAQERWQEVMTGAYCQLKGFMFKGLFLREYQGDHDEEGGYTRYVEMPLSVYINTNGSEVMPEFERNGWPIEGVTCTHSYSPCGQLYCSPVTLIRNGDMMRFVQRVWRNV